MREQQKLLKVTNDINPKYLSETIISIVAGPMQGV
jgi:hypothetical protein